MGELRVVAIPGLTRPALSTLPDFSYGNTLARGAGEFAKNLSKKNTQLAVPDHERVVLVLNAAPLVDAEDAVRALATSDTSRLANIDSIYFYSPNGGHSLVYERAVRDAFALGKVPPEADTALLEAWMNAKLAAHADDAVRLARHHSERLGSMSWLSRETRALFVHRVGEMVENGDIELGLWAAETAVGDPDPPLENYPDDPTAKWNGHRLISDHKDSTNVLTVRSQACWLLQKLVVARAGVHEAKLLEHVARLARDENAHVRMHAAIPLIELASRRRRVDCDGRPLMPSHISARVRTLALEMLRANSHLPRVLDWVTKALLELGDLSTPEALVSLPRFGGHRRKGLSGVDHGPAEDLKVEATFHGGLQGERGSARA